MRSLVLAAGLCALSSPSLAGQLMIHEYGLREVAEHGEVLVGTVRATRPEGRSLAIQLEVRRTFRRERAGAPDDAARPVPAVGDGPVWRTIYPGVEWTDPRKSPIEYRLRGGRRGAAVGDEVVAVPAMGGGGAMVELLPADASTLGALAILFAADPKAEMGRLDLAELERRIEDADLGDLAAAELARRGKLGARVLLRADRRVLERHWRSLPAGARRRLLGEAVPLAAADRAARDRLLGVVLGDLDPKSVGAVAPLVALYHSEPAQPDDQGRLGDVRLELLGLAERSKEARPPRALDLSPFAEFLLVYELRRPDYQSADEDLPKLTAFLDAATRARLAEGFLRGAYTSSHAGRDGNPDGFLLDEAARLAREAPSPALLAPLATIDPTRPRVTSTKEWVMEAILEIGVAIARAHPERVLAVRDLVDGWFDAGAVAGDEARDRARKILGAPRRRPPASASLELSPGQLGRLPSGERVRWLRVDQEGFELSVAGRGDGDESQAWGFDNKDDWYREWYLAPYLVISRRVAADKIGMRFTPATPEPKEVGQPELMEMARKISARRGCPDYVADDYDSFRGRFEYRSEGPGGKKCGLLLGVRTRKVIRLSP